MTNETVVRTLEVRGTSSGLDRLAAELNKVSAAHDKAATASTNATSVTEGASRRQLSVSNAYDRLRRSVDAAYDAEQRYAKAESLGKRAIAQGHSVSEVNAVLDAYRAKLTGVSGANDNFSKTTGAAAYQIQNLRYQLTDVVQGLATGQSPLQVLLQQGGQIASVFGPGQGGVLGILRGISQAIPRSFAIGGAAGAVLGIPLIAAERYQREEAESRRSVLGVGRGSGLTAQDIERSAGDPYSRQGGLSVSQGRDLARAVAGTGYGSQTSITQARDMFRDLSATLGESADDINQRFATLFRDPVKGADELNARLGFLTGSTRDYIKSLAEQGDNTKAAEVAMRAMTGTLGKYDQLTGATARTFDTAKGVFSDFFFTVQRGGDRVITALTDQAKTSEQVADRVAAAEKRQTDAVKAASEEQVRRIRDRAEVLTSTLERSNLLARRDPLSQQVFEAQREAGVAPALTARDREAERALTDQQRAERGRQADLIARQVAERNTIDLGKALTEQTRANTLTIEAETLALGRNIAVQERLRFVAAARIAAGQGGKAISQEVEAQILREARAYGQLAEALSRARLGDQVSFDRSQLGRTQGDAQIASQIRSAGLGSIEDPANEATVSQLRLNAALAETKSIAGDSLKGFISDLRNGTTASQALANALGRIGDKLLDKTLDSALSGLFKTGGQGSGGGLLDGLLGAVTKGLTAGGPSQAIESATRQAAARAGRTVQSAITPGSIPNIATEPLQVTVRPSGQALDALPPSRPYFAPTSDQTRSFDLSRFGGWSDTAGPRDDLVVRMAGPLEAKAAEIAQAGQSTADALSQTAQGIGQSGSALANSLSSIAQGLGGAKLPDRLPSLPGGGFSFGGGGGSAIDWSLPDWSSGLSFAFANGGVMTSRGALPLNRYAQGGIADTPQVAIFGEGRGPEAYVPLPDGRSIPVSINIPLPAANANVPAGGSVSVSHAPVYNITPAAGVTPEQLASVVDRNNRQFAADLPRLLQQAQRRRA